MEVFECEEAVEVALREARPKELVQIINEVCGTHYASSIVDSSTQRWLRYGCSTLNVRVLA